MEYQETSKHVFQSEGLNGIDDWEEVFKVGRSLGKPMAVLDVRSAKYPNANRFFPSGWASIWMPIPEQSFRVTEEFEALDFFRAAGRITKAYHDSGYALWILCAAGVSRSTAVNIAFRMMTYKENRDTAFKAIQKVNPYVGPNIFFWSVLLRLEDEIHGKITSSMPSSQMRLPHCTNSPLA